MIDDIGRLGSDERATRLLRAAGPEGNMLANRCSVRVKSPTEPIIEYLLSANAQEHISVYRIDCEREYPIGRLCVVPIMPCPASDILLSKLWLCQYDEKQLWNIGRWYGRMSMVPERFWPKAERESLVGKKVFLDYVLGQGGAGVARSARGW